MTWCVSSMRPFPGCLDRLRAEINAAVPDRSTPITHAAVRELPYLNAVINESQRLRPISPHGMSRIVPKEGVMLGGYFIPGGTTILASIKTLQEDKNVFPDPMAFKPERWLADESTVATMKRSLIPFQIGPRACIGRVLAMMEMRLTIAELVRHFAFEIPPHLQTDMTPVNRFIYRPKDNKYVVLPHRID
ncbi:cytochrome P450 [Thamnocephalis sphaerospora]|uniref:Cytochrome P450 n=1 Tax=Thamnocephalis sphaerospora TaxID=78915 RepID=A0A4P9XG81_9FUNG|nr:cytochrome P450 [Thamnocephalis sphaerospora]|eukprot:RKP04624.1 cytochrome P450 [Thamnocephalis sphaerospora]